MTKARDLADLISADSILSDGAIEPNEITGVTVSAAEINRLSGVTSNVQGQLDVKGTVSTLSDLGITATTEELNNVAGVNSDVQTQLDGKQSVVAGVSSTEIGYLDGVTSALQTQLDGKQAIVAGVSNAEIGYLDGVTSNLQTQLDNISVTSGSLTKSFASGETSSISLSSALSPAPVVSVTKEVPQVGTVSKGSWDVVTNGANYDRLDSAYDTTLTPISEGWDVSTASYVQNFSVSAQEATPEGIFFKPDGTKMYIVGRTGDAVYEYDLSTAWDVSTASFNQLFSVLSQEINPQGIFFKPDGTKMYITGNNGDAVYEYNLSTAWDISTASFNQLFSVSAQETTLTDIFFKPDGTKMYIIGNNGDDVNEYDLSTAWDVSTASFSQLFSLANEDDIPFGIFFKPDGLKMYIAGNRGDDINEYDLSTAWDVSTASFNQLFSVANEDNTPTGIFFKPDGTKMYIIGGAGDDVNEYNLTATDTLTLGSGSFAASDVGKTIEGNGGAAVLTATDGSYIEVTAFTDSSTISAGDWGMYGAVFDATNGLEMSFTAINTWDISTASYLQNFSVSAQESNPQGLFFKPDGTKMYVLGSSGDDVNEYDLSTAWDISTASYVENFNILAEESNPQDIFFKPDGTKMYVIGATGDDVNEYYLSTAWDVSTAFYLGNFSLASEESIPQGLFFKPDGTKMYVLGSSGDDVNEYDLTIAWDVSTASFLQNFSVSAQESTPQSLFFKTDGTKMYVIGGGGNDVNEYNLSIAWDVSTASYSQNFNVSAQDLNPNGIFFKPDGTKMYVLGTDGNNVNEYNIGFVASNTGYTPSITNSIGQINSAFWLDINGMTTDEAASNGNVYYAVSTDDRTTWSVINEADGVRPIVRDNAGTWEYNTAVSIVDGWNISSASFVQSFSIASQDGSPEGLFFKPDGTKMYVIGATGDDVNEYNLSTSWDVSTASFFQAFLVQPQETSPTDLFFKPDGTKMYITGNAGDDVNEYDLSIAWDVSTASFVQSFGLGFPNTRPTGVFFKPDGTKMYFLDGSSRNLNECNLSTAWDVSTASLFQYYFVYEDTSPEGVFFKPDGTKMYIIGNTGDDVNEYDLSIAWDVSTASFLQNFSLASEESNPRGVYFKPDGSKMYVIGYTGDDVNEYNIGSTGYTTSTTWTNSTTNSELYALQQALTQVSINRMDKTQLEAVTDPNHYTLGNTLDLMIGLYLGSESASVPSSDGVSINYDAESLNQGAVLGTDYDYDFPDSTTVRITSNAAQNLKIRVV